MEINTEKYQQAVTKLNEKISQSSIKSREVGGGIKLDYLEGWYVIARLNDILGIGNWSYQLEELTLVHSGTISNGKGEKYAASYIARVTLNVSIAGKTTYFTDVGFGDGFDKNSPGKPHELASKEAVTDAVKRCAKNLGMSLGLALYDKDRDFVASAEETLQKAAQESKQAPKALGKKLSRDEINALISSTAQVVVAKKKASMDDLIDGMKKTYKVLSKDALTDEQAEEFLGTLQTLIK